MFTKRLTDENIRNDERYSSNANPFHATGTYAMPNCTCYAYGRVWEINGVEPKGLCLRNAKYWFNESTGFEKGMEPRLGAIMCFDGVAGHVAVVEQILENGDVVISQSNFGGEFFFTKTLKKSSNYNNYFTNVKFMGFLYTYNGEDAISNFNKPVPTKSVEEVAKKVVNGEYGNGADRKAKLEAEGYNYNEVQDRVNALLGNQQATNLKPLETVAREVIKGQWGNGADRKARLTNAGYDPSAVQNKVNQLL